MIEIAAEVSSPNYAWVWPFSRTLLATFAGAAVAILLQNWRDKLNRKTAEVAVLNRTTIALGQMQNELINYRQQAIEPFLDTHVPFIEMQPMIIGNLTHLRLHADDFVFLCETEHRQVPLQVGNTDLIFIRAAAAIETRTNYHMKEFQPRLASAFERSETPTVEEIQQKIGVVPVTMLRSHTDAMQLYVDEALKQIDKCIALLKKTGKAIYGKGRVITIERISPTAIKPSNSQERQQGD